MLMSNNLRVLQCKAMSFNYVTQRHLNNTKLGVCFWEMLNYFNYKIVGICYPYCMIKCPTVHDRQC